MMESLFILWIWILGLTLNGTLVYGLVNFAPDTVTQYMIDSVIYRIVVTTCVMSQIIVWFWCIWSKRLHGNNAAFSALIFLSIIIVSWVVLSNILTTTTHFVFAFIFMFSYMIFIVLLIQITFQTTALWILYACLFLFVVCGIAMFVLLDSPQFYIPEQIAFLTYGCAFIAFFSVHTFREWKVNDEDLDLLPRSNWKHGNIWDENEDNEDVSGIFYVRNGALLWIPIYRPKN